MSILVYNSMNLMESIGSSAACFHAELSSYPIMLTVYGIIDTSSPDCHTKHHQDVGDLCFQ
jgi:hypothetical protein